MDLDVGTSPERAPAGLHDAFDDSRIRSRARARRDRTFRETACRLLAVLSLASFSSAAIAQQAVIGSSTGSALVPAPRGISPAIPAKDLSALGAAAQLRAMQAAVPVERRMRAAPVEARQVKQADAPVEASPRFVAGGASKQASAPPIALALPDAAKSSLGIGNARALGPQNYGLAKLNSIFHYTDSLVTGLYLANSPHRSTGWFVFVAANGDTFRCSASLISKSILVTAGHCVHDGGNKAAGWIRSGTFFAGYQNGFHLGVAPVRAVYTTPGWYNFGALDSGYDIGVVVLGKRTDTPSPGLAEEIGTSIGWLGFCYADCLHRFWHLSQLGYPRNYYNGNYQTRSEHLSASDTRDYVYGSGMQHGSSGGPHISNFGFLSDSSFDQGQNVARNVVFGVTSWGYEDESFKIQGGSSLSGPSNGNNFKNIWNLACRKAQSLHGTATCALLP